MGGNRNHVLHTVEVPEQQHYANMVSSSRKFYHLLEIERTSGLYLQTPVQISELDHLLLIEGKQLREHSIEWGVFDFTEELGLEGAFMEHGVVGEQLRGNDERGLLGQPIKIKLDILFHV